MKTLILCLALLSGANAFAQDAPAPAAPAAPEDQLRAMQTQEAYQAYEQATAPYVAKARETYPDAKKRFLSGELGSRPFFVTVRLAEDGHYEDSFVRVLAIDDRSGTISGKIATQIQGLRTYHNDQRIIVQEKDVRDWTIVNPDGTEEGNVVGKFLDHYQP